MKTKRIILPNGLILHSAWYEHPWLDRRGRIRKSDKEVERLQKKALAEDIWLWEQVREREGRAGSNS